MTPEQQEQALDVAGYQNKGRVFLNTKPYCMSQLIFFDMVS